MVKVRSDRHKAIIVRCDTITFDENGEASVDQEVADVLIDVRTSPTEYELVVESGDPAKTADQNPEVVPGGDADAGPKAGGEEKPKQADAGPEGTTDVNSQAGSEENPKTDAGDKSGASTATDDQAKVAGGGKPVDRMTVDELKAYCKEHAIEVPADAKKKADILALVKGQMTAE